MQLAQVCETLGTDEILLKCIDKGGTNSGFDLKLVNQVSKVVSIPVIASSGGTRWSISPRSVAPPMWRRPALAAGIFQRREVPIAAVMEHIRKKGIETETR